MSTHSLFQDIATLSISVPFAVSRMSGWPIENKVFWLLGRELHAAESKQQGLLRNGP